MRGISSANRKPKPTVGASLLAMVVENAAGCQRPRCVLGFIASRLAPTVSSAASKIVYTGMSPSVPFMCALFFYAPKSYIPPTALPPHSLLNSRYKINTCSIGQFILSFFQ
ncbi:hypothetical protein CRX42_26195 [Pseudomonas jessenii]|uniref:Uncharacterized protein n=1 Tax=Pseudomonas jessenii TaxID=77298 RepID=A0A2W0EPF1_PSEJE|nr:hypothetical protein CRX42_26195 [Pseudomonas jessenii]